MAATSHIEWTDATWNPVTGCSVVSPGCSHCYAMKLAGTRLQHHPSRAGLTTPSKAGPVWNGHVRFNEAWLRQPLTWKAPKRIFVCAHGDLFHESVPDAWIDQVFAVMALAPQHTFQVLTKRAQRMRDYVGPPSSRMVQRLSDGLGAAVIELGYRGPLEALAWPLPNVWLGVSVEDQPRLQERVPHLLATPAAIRFVSAEPALATMDFTDAARWRELDTVYRRDALSGVLFEKPASLGDFQKRKGTLSAWTVADCGLPKLDLIILGGESGPGARPMHPDWVRQIRDACAAADVAFFFKQWGDWEPREEWSGHQGGGRFETMRAIMPCGRECPDDVAPQDVGAQRMALVGKKAAGRLLDGRSHDAMPEAH